MLSHMLIFITNRMLVKESLFYLSTFIGQTLFYSLGIAGSVMEINYLIHYYLLTVTAQ